MVRHLEIGETTGCGMAAVMARKGVDARTIGERLGLVAPVTPAWTGDGALSLIGVAPGGWLARAEGADADWAEALAGNLAGLASVTDLSGSYRLFRIAGDHAPRLLRRGAFVDFHPAAFAPGSVAVTVIAHIGVIIRQLDDTPAYELAVFRSLGESLRHWLDTTAATL